MNSLPVDRLHEIFELRDSGDLIWKNPKGPTRASRVAGTVSNFDGYRYVTVERVRLRAHRIVFAMANRRWSELYIDHINGNKDDNRPCNLREATQSQNIGNSKISKNNKSGYKGVCFRPDLNKYVAQMHMNGKQTYIGSFATAEAAHEAYVAASIKEYGEFARAG